MSVQDELGEQEAIELSSDDEGNKTKQSLGAKKLKLGDKGEDSLWRPQKVPNHCSEGKEYLRKHSKCVEIFKYLELSKRSTSSNWIGLCLACEFQRTGSSSVLLDHFIDGGCSARNAPEPEREVLLAELVKMAKARQESISRNAPAVEASRQPADDPKALSNANTMGSYLSSAKSKQTALLDQTAKLFVACNMPARLAEHPMFREYIQVISGKKIDSGVAEVLKRKAVTRRMDEHAADINKRSFATFCDSAQRRGGSLLVDGWTAARLVGTMGVALASLAMCHIVPVLISAERSRAQDYFDKLSSADSIPWNLMFFICTDGASNMVTLGELFLENKLMLNVLCAAHGFSLMVHYIGKVFEERSQMFSKVAGIIAFFNRSPQRMLKLREEYKSDICFIKFCKTRMAYQTLSLMRVFRLREAAQKAMIALKKQFANEDESQIDSFSRFAQVDGSLNNDKLFKEIEVFCRVTFPVLLALREVDRGTPMAGFVYWLNYHVEVQINQITDKMVQADSRFKSLATNVSAGVAQVWQKRHTPVLSVAYLSNPLLHFDLAKETNVFDLDDRFGEDVDHVFLTMMKRRYDTGDEETRLSRDEIMVKLVQAKTELTLYLRPNGLTEVQQYDAKHMLASQFWTDSTAARRYPELAWCASRIHAMPVVTSKLERFFSNVGNVQTEKRACLDAQRASLYAAAHQELVHGGGSEEGSLQIRLIELVRRCEAIETEEDVLKFEGLDGFQDLETWLEKIRGNNLELLYASNSPEDQEQNRTEGLDSRNPSAGAAGEITVSSVLDELDETIGTGTYTSEAEERRSSRSRRAPRRLNL
jgi:hAT family C-terminal dimerisation region